MSILKNNTSEFHQLKTLLLSDELEQLKELESKVKTLDLRMENPESIKAAVLPLFDTLLLERLQSKDSRTIQIISDHLAQIITQTSQDSPEALSQSLQSVIGSAIGQEIKNNKEMMIDSLYPIMGGMISKYVSQALKEMMESINAKIEDGLSVKTYKRKIKSKITGVSETELLLEESADARISSLFVIHKESGLLIAEGHIADKEIGDMHMVASMASAIKDFINDWIQHNESNNEVQILSYANETLYIESAGSVYLIAFLDKEPDSELRANINDLFASLVSKYATFFQNFDGDDSTPEVKALSETMTAYLQTETKMKELSVSNNSQKPFKYIMGFLALFFVGYMAYLSNGWYFEYQLEQEIKEKTGERVALRQTKETMEVTGYVDSFAHARQVATIISQKSQKILINHLAIPINSIDRRMAHIESKDKYGAKISDLEKKIASMEDRLRMPSKENTIKNRGDAKNATQHP